MTPKEAIVQAKEKLNNQIADKIVYLAISGSHSYGLATPTSDIDIRGVTLLSHKDYFNFLKDKQQTYEIIGDEFDIVVYTIDRFFKLAYNSNPHILEMLYSDIKYDLGILLKPELFLSQRIKATFLGYAISEAKRINSIESFIESSNIKDFSEVYKKLNKARSHFLRLYDQCEYALINGSILLNDPMRVNDWKDLKEGKKVTRFNNLFELAKNKKLSLDHIKSVLPEEPDLNVLNQEYKRIIKDEYFK